MRVEFTTLSESETLQFGAALARALRPGDVLAIDGELGAGKTRLIRGVATALGVAPEQIASPTYVIAHRYVAHPPAAMPAAAQRIGIVHHLDAYRLLGADELDSIGWEQIQEPNDGDGTEGGNRDASRASDSAVMLLEWASRISAALAELDANRVAHLQMAATEDGSAGPSDSNHRRLTLELPATWAERVELEALFNWALVDHSLLNRQASDEPQPSRPHGASSRLLSGLPKGWTRCPTTQRAVSAHNPAFPFVDSRARDADLNRWFTGSYTISRDLTPDDESDVDPASGGGLI